MTTSRVCTIAAWCLCSALIGPTASGQTNFTLDTVSDGQWPMAVSSTVDQYGTIHVFCFNNVDKTFQYAYQARGESSWTLEIIDGPANWYTYWSSLAVDSQGNPHVCYKRDDTDSLRYGVRSGGAWQIENVDYLGSGRSVSLALDSQDKPHLAYQSQEAAGLRQLYANKVGMVWTREWVDSTASGYGCSISLNDYDLPRVSYFDPTSELRYARRDPVTIDVWTSEVLTTTKNPPSSHSLGSSLAIDDGDRPQVVFADFNFWDSVLYHMERADDGTWVKSEIDSIGNRQNAKPDAFLALTEGGAPRVAYYHASQFGPSTVRYAARNGGQWESEVLDFMDAPVGSIVSISLSLDRQDNPVVGYREESMGSLKVADSRIRLLQPTKGTVWPVGSQRVVEWRGAGPVDLLLSTDGGNSYQQLDSGVTRNLVPLVVPHRPTRFARLRISRETPFSTAESDSFFSIEASIVLLGLAVAPATEGGVLVSWETDPGPEDLSGYKLERSLANGGDWRVLASQLRETEYLDVEGTTHSKYRLHGINGFGTEVFLGETSAKSAPALAAWPLPYRGGSLTVSFLTAGGVGGGQSLTEVDVFDLRGRLVRELVRAEYHAGHQTVTWDGRDSMGRPIGNGLYFIRSRTMGVSSQIKLLVLR